MSRPTWAQGLGYLLILAGATATSCVTRVKYAGPLATMPTPAPSVSLPILDPLLKPELSVFGTVSGASGESTGWWFTVDSGWTAMNVPEQAAQQLKLREFGRGRVLTAVGHGVDESVALAPRVTFAQLVASDVLVGTVGQLAVLGQAILRHSPWMPTSCGHVGCIRARINPQGEHALLEIEREAPLPVATAWVLACAEPDHVAPSATLVEQLTARRLRLPFERIVLRLSASAPTMIATQLAFASRLWFRPGAQGCTNLEVLDVVALPSNEAIAGGAAAQISP